MRPGWVPPLPRGRRCSPGEATVDLLHRCLPLPSGQSLHSAGTSHRLEPTITRHQSGVHVLHPSGLLLACDPRMERGSSGSPRGSAPRRNQRRTPEWRQALSTDPELRSRQHQSVLQSACSLKSCDLMSHGRLVLHSANSHRLPSRTCRPDLAPDDPGPDRPSDLASRFVGAVVTPTNHHRAHPVSASPVTTTPAAIGTHDGVQQPRCSRRRPSVKCPPGSR